MSKTRWCETARAILRALAHLNHYEAPSTQEPPLSRREAARRFKAKLAFRYRTLNRCC